MLLPAHVAAMYLQSLFGNGFLFEKGHWHQRRQQDLIDLCATRYGRQEIVVSESFTSHNVALKLTHKQSFIFLRFDIFLFKAFRA